MPVIRFARRRDVPALLELVREYYVFDHHAFHRQHARAALTQLIENKSLGRVWMVEDNGAPAGYLVLTYGFSLEFLGRDAFVDEVYLRPAYRGRGWGREALRTLEKAARMAGVKAIHLEAMRGNERARRVYRRLGFARRPSDLMTKPLSARRTWGKTRAHG